MSATQDDRRWHVTTAPAGEADRHAAGWLLAVLLAAFALAAPFAREPWPPMPAFIAAYDVAIVVLALITAVVLHGQLPVAGGRALAWLAAGYGLIALQAGAHALSFPDAFRPGSLIGDAQTTAWLWMAWHGGFPLFVLAYMRARRDGSSARVGRVYAVAALVGLAMLALAIAGEPWLPSLMSGSHYRSLRTWLVLGTGWGLHLVAIAVVWRATRGRTLLDLWLLMSLAADAIDLTLSGMLVSGRFQAGFYVGRVYGLAATAFVLARLLLAGSDLQWRFERARRDLRASERLYADLLERIPQLVWRTDPSGFATWASPQWHAFTGEGVDHLHGERWMRLVHAEDRDATRNAWIAATASRDYDVEHRLRRADGAWVWHRSRACPRFDDDGRLVEWLGTSTDIDELKRLYGQQGVMVGELQHRTRNLLGVVSAIAEKTATSATDLADFRERFRERLQALSRVQGLLSGLDAGQRVSFDQLLQAELAGLGALDRVVLDGPAGVPLRAGSVQTFALGLHELGTNAVKYGALSQPDGRLTVRWRVEREGNADWLAMEWEETGVRGAARTPTRRGFGRDLIERALPYQLRARTQFELREDGVRCRIRVPLEPGP